MASRPSVATSPVLQESISRGTSPATGTSPPTRTTRTDDGVPLQEDDDLADEKALTGFLKADSPTTVIDNVYIILGHGRYQLFVLCCFVLSGFMMLTHILAYQLVGRRMRHWCRPPDNFRYLTPDAWKNAAIPLLSDGTLSGCTVYDPPMEAEGAERRQVPCHEWDYSDHGSHDSVISRWNLVCERQWLYQFSLFLYMLGPVFSCPVVGVLSDHFGRRPVIIALVWNFLVASVVSAVSNSFLMFLTARVLISATSYTASALLFILVYEVTGNEYRAIHAFLSIAFILTLAPPVVNVLSWLEPSWYLAQGLLIVPIILLALWCSLLHESPTWLLATWKTHQAEHNILRTARINGVNMLRAKVTFRALVAQMKIHEESTSTPAISSKTSTPSTFLSGGSPLSVAIAWFTLTLILYVLFLPAAPKTWLEVGARLVLQTLFFTAICWYMRWKGYRHALWLSLILLCVFLSFFAVVYIEGYTRLIAISRILAEQATHSAVTVNYCYTAEVFHTAVRANGFFLSVFVGRFGGLLATLAPLNPGRTTTMVIHMALALLALLTAVGVQWLPEVAFFKKKIKSKVTASELISEKQRKEVIKASLPTIKKSSKTRTMSRRRHRDKPRARCPQPDSPPVIETSLSPNNAEVPQP